LLAGQIAIYWLPLFAAQPLLPTLILQVPAFLRPPKDEGDRQKSGAARADAAASECKFRRAMIVVQWNLP
jgi:hypothetical protein